ncbi:histidine kinase [Paraflavitalea sp. CAU 1676]|uniref:sensor histidine kinase n=1 Tax=Paraflavitalea sp. CAU 1676 TaxID=3032598 RepID=UPI0023DA9001|nr:histidine kinase [Paraflavitalea sp. CAU 1676]MDF2189923.1 histidine kinase [Paraflavitalea sp. CAU 1676]
MSRIAWNHLLTKRVLWTITVKELLLWLLFNIVYGLLFYLALHAISGGQKIHGIYVWLLLDVFIEIFIQGLLTIPLWWLFFRRLSDKPIPVILVTHVVLVSAFLYLRGVSEGVVSKLTCKESGAFFYWHAYYLPMLFYVIQFSIFHAYNFWLKSQRQVEKEKELMSLAYQSEVNALKAQIQPHFLFNTLNSISATVPPEMEATRVLIARLADTFRYALKSTQKHQVTLGEELDFIRTWIELEMHRFKSRLKVEYHTDESVLQLQIPPMLLQPLVENAVKHGIGGSITGGTIKISCIREGRHAKIIISDTGAGFKGDLQQLERTEGIGLKNTRLRLLRLYNEELFVEPNVPSGLTSYFYIPL